MTTRRTVLRLAAAAPAAAFLAACGTNDSGRGSPNGGSVSRQSNAGSLKPADLLLVATASGLALVDARDARVVAGPRRGVAAWDGSALVTDVPTDASTTIEVRGRTGALNYGVAVAGNLGARVVSPGGERVALTSGSASGDSPYRPSGRETTTIVIAGAAGERTRLTLPGCVEPEAFGSVFGSAASLLYVLDYLPPTKPDRYRVRMIDLATGELQPLFTRNKQLIPPGAEEEMRGEGRQAVYAKYHGSLFTLYTHQPEHEHTRDLLRGGARSDAPHVHAFVHTLSLDGQYAYCIDLPAPFGEGPAHSHAIALSPLSENPIVVDASTGTIAQLNGGDLTVTRTATALPRSPGTTATAAVSDDDQRLLVGVGDRIHVVRAGALTAQTEWRAPAPIRGMAMSSDGARLWVGQPDHAVAFDASSGRQVATVAIPGLTSLDNATTP